jgi:pimeloyl-ACP methyl ester carboxylesterase
MVTPVAMPRLGMSMREGTVRAWSVPVGGRVARGQTLLVIESEKAEVELQATADGILRHVYVPVGETVPCGSLLAALTASAEEPFDPESFARAQGGAAPHARSEEGVAEAAGAPRTPGGAPGRSGGAAAGAEAPGTAAGHRPVTPAARARARALGIDVAEVPGTGPGCRVTREDVETFAARSEGLVPVAAGISLEVGVDGSGEPLVFLPGFGTDLSSFAFQTRAFAASHRVIGVSPRGVGLSDAPSLDAYDVADAARDAAGVIETVAGGSAHVVGASLGAAVALELALVRPGLVRSLALVTPFVETTPRLAALLDAWCQLGAAVAPELLARTLLPWLFSDALLADAGRRDRTARGLAASCARVPAATLRRTAAGLAAWAGSRTGALGKVSAPTLVLVAGGDLLVSGGEAIARAIPGARCAVVPGAGHAVAIEDPDAVERLLRTHLPPP